MTPPRPSRSAFTLIELLVVIAIIAVLASLLMPAVIRARDRALQAYCTSQQRQLVLANKQYANDHDRYVPAAIDIFSSNLQRWHGTRASGSEPFDAATGPLVPYLGAGKQIRTCPAFDSRNAATVSGAFEASCGGYGYNAVGIGSQAYLHGFNQKGLSDSMTPGFIGPPATTLMFGDTAFPQPYGNPTHLIEYSFAEAYYFIAWNGPGETTSRAIPSIHFRHNDTANIAWADGHVTAEARTLPHDPAFDLFQVGWFGTAGNDAFDLQ